jgi:hypothetical protein
MDKAYGLSTYGFVRKSPRAYGLFAHGLFKKCVCTEVDAAEQPAAEGARMLLEPPLVSPRVCLVACERRGNTLQVSKGFHLKTMAGIWP